LRATVNITGANALTAAVPLTESAMMTATSALTPTVRPGQLPHTGQAFGALDSRSLFVLLLVFLLVVSAGLWDRRRLGKWGSS
jgi:hypothetical protein